jgi:transcriptional regulator with XRE-family HTH domain
MTIQTKRIHVRSNGESKAHINSFLSRNIVTTIHQQQGRTYKMIGDMIGCGESYISRVANGKRAFTLKHLAALEKKLGKPMPLLILESTDINNLTPEMKPLYEYLLKLMSGVRPTEIKRQKVTIKK